MCDPKMIKWGERNLSYAEVNNKRVLEVGSRNVNGSFRDHAESLSPVFYVGVDIEDGDGVDEVCDVYNLQTRFGINSFDVVICTEVVEHVSDWELAMFNIKRVLRPGGILLLSTRCIGFPYHGYPHDYWRYEPEDIEEILYDFDIVSLDRVMKGVAVKAKKRNISLFSINDKERRQISEEEVKLCVLRD